MIVPVGYSKSLINIPHEKSATNIYEVCFKADCPDEYIPSYRDLEGVSVFEACKNVSDKVRGFFGWTQSDKACGHLRKEVDELQEGINNKDKENIEEEVGDVLFIASQVADLNGVNPEIAMNKANQKFVDRFQKMQEISDKPLIQNSREKNRKLWNDSKFILRSEKDSSKVS